MSTSEHAAPARRPPRAFLRRVAAARLPTAQVSTAPVTEAELAGLPRAAVRYLTAMGVVGRPRIWSLRAHFTGRFRRGPGRPWMPLDAWQYNSALEVARLFRMRLTVARVLPMWGWDTYRAGTGRMLGKALGLVTVADGAGPEFDIGELTTWLNDAVLLAPGMLLDGRVSWEDAGEDGFRISLTDAGRTVSAHVSLDPQGRPRDFRTQDRWADLPGGPVRALWSTPILGWTEVDGCPRMTGGAAVWHLPDGEFRYGELSLVELAVNVAAGR
ncbi:hypothetical protein LWC33_27280 [Pseudonocardia sp. RS11V-5]|uniref:DUF6544 family protein n=1 Tax=Pseudonocardia terrae TaxID=2905831 RepID=UPI001E5A6B2D|nr:DUF6544 family protein [Pseudonocardia terrae]MCE3555145.1 hypothetical protein [Pseudonocardia terrae]